jgi:hypothetical protein
MLTTPSGESYRLSAIGGQPVVVGYQLSVFGFPRGAK